VTHPAGCSTVGLNRVISLHEHHKSLQVPSHSFPSPIFNNFISFTHAQPQRQHAFISMVNEDIASVAAFASQVLELCIQVRASSLQQNKTNKQTNTQTKNQCCTHTQFYPQPHPNTPSSAAAAATFHRPTTPNHPPPAPPPPPIPITPQTTAEGALARVCGVGVRARAGATRRLNKNSPQP